MTYWQRLWCWEGLGGRRRRGRQRMRWLDGITTRWMRVWVNSGSWWWTGRPGMLRFMGSQRVGHDWATELNWTDNRKESGKEYIICVCMYASVYIWLTVVYTWSWHAVWVSCRLGARSVASSSLWPMDCGPRVSIHGISEARILERVAISSSRGSSWPRDWTQDSKSPASSGRLFTTSTT